MIKEKTVKNNKKNMIKKTNRKVKMMVRKR